MYQVLATKNEVAFPLYPDQVAKIDSVVKTVHATYFGFSRYPSTEDKAAAYFVFLIKDHPVTDGNKRLAVLFLEFFCTAFDLHIDLPSDITLDEFAVGVERGGEANTLVEPVKELLFGGWRELLNRAHPEKDQRE